MGPLIDAESKERALNWIASAKAEGARVIVGGEETDEGLFPPTRDGRCDRRYEDICEEVFATHRFSGFPVPDYESAIRRRMNESPFGIAVFPSFTQPIWKMTQAFIDDAPVVRCGDQ